MKLLDYFDYFMRSTVNLSERKLDLLDSRVDSIVVRIGLDDEVGPMLRGHTPQGSWAHQTIIEPVGGREFDADILLELDENEDWNASPKQYTAEVYAAFRRSAYRDMVRQKTRCIRVVYANDCHVDVVPYIVRADGTEVIVNSVEDKFEDTNPTGFTSWMKDKDDLANRNLRRVIRLLKYLRDYKTTFSVPSVILTTFLGERVQAWDADSRYRDLPTALLNLTADLDSWLQLNPSMPLIEDPSCPGTHFNHRWDEERYANFRTQINRYAGWIREAYEESDRDKSLLAWQRIFGEDFMTPPAAVSEAAKASVAPAPTAALEPAPREEFIEDRYPFEVTRRASIKATAGAQSGFRAGPISRRPYVAKYLRITFELTTDVPAPDEVFWKVRNTGDEAREADHLRGQLLKDEGRQRRVEPTRYTGKHYVDVYVVKDRKVVATDRVIVRIR